MCGGARPTGGFVDCAHDEFVEALMILFAQDEDLQSELSFAYPFHLGLLDHHRLCSIRKTNAQPQQPSDLHRLIAHHTAPTHRDISQRAFSVRLFTREFDRELNWQAEIPAYLHSASWPSKRNAETSARTTFFETMLHAILPRRLSC